MNVYLKTHSAKARYFCTVTNPFPGTDRGCPHGAVVQMQVYTGREATLLIWVCPTHWAPFRYALLRALLEAEI